MCNHHKRNAEGAPAQQPTTKRHISTTHWAEQHTPGARENIRPKQPYEDISEHAPTEPPHKKIRKTQRLRTRPYPRPTSWVHDPTQDAPTHPVEPNECIPEVSSSDDRRIFAFTDEGMCYVPRVIQKTCLAGGGANNCAKLQALCLTLREGAVQYKRGTIETALGALQACTYNLAMVKVPIATGECPLAILVNYRDALRHLGWALPRTPPSYAQAARVATSFALERADFVFHAVPVMGIDLIDV